MPFHHLPRLSRNVRLQRCGQLFLALALVIAVGSCSGEATVPEKTRVDLDARSGSVPIRAGVIDLTTPPGRTLAAEGWHLPGADHASPSGLWASSTDATLWAPSVAGAFEELSLELEVPDCVPTPYGLEVFLNESSIGSFSLEAGPTTLKAAVPPGLGHAGMNLVRLHGDAVRSPAAAGKGADTRELGVRVSEVRLVGEDPRDGRFLRIRVPADAALAIECRDGASVLVQDAQSFLPVGSSEGAGQVSIDLGAQANRDLLVCVWGSTSHLFLVSKWVPVNLIVIVCDTLRADILSAVDTPNLDALASESVVFSNSFSHAPMTLPSHTALFSSRYPHVSGIVNNGQEVPPSLPLLSSWLESFGYDTRAVASLGTLWLGKREASLDRGFRTFQHVRGDDTVGEESVVLMDEVIGDLSPQRPFFFFAHFADPHEPYRDTASPPLKGLIRIDGEVVGEFNPRDAPHVDLTADLAAGDHEIAIECEDHDIRVRSLHLWSDEGRRRRLDYEFAEGGLFQNVRSLRAGFHLSDPSTLSLETFVGDVLDTKEARARYMQEVERFDRAIGELIDALKGADCWENSLVVFTSDHGEALRDHRLVGHVQNLYDELLHVPLMIRTPDGEAWAETRAALEEARDKIIRHIDLVPTILDVLGLPPLPGQMGEPIIRNGDHTLIAETHAPEAKRDLFACRDDAYKMVYRPDDQTFTMYDLRSDPKELRDIFQERGGERPRWQELLRTLAENWKEGAQGGVAEEERDRLRAMGYF